MTQGLLDNKIMPFVLDKKISTKRTKYYADKAGILKYTFTNSCPNGCDTLSQSTLLYTIRKNATEAQNNTYEMAVLKFLFNASSPSEKVITSWYSDLIKGIESGINHGVQQLGNIKIEAFVNTEKGNILFIVSDTLRE